MGVPDFGSGAAGTLRGRLERREQTDLYRAAYAGPVVPGTANRRRLSDFRFDQNLYIAEVQAQSRADWAGVQHRFTYGASLEVTETTRPRQRVEVNLLTRARTSTIGGETFPNKNFPDTVGTQAGVYVQDEITIGRLELTPAVRLNHFSLTPHPDAASNRASGGLLVRPISDFASSSHRRRGDELGKIADRQAISRNGSAFAFRTQSINCRCRDLYGIGRYE